MARTTTSPEFRPDSDLDRDAVGATHLLGVATHGGLHVERRIAGSHRMVLVGERRAEEGHDPVAHDLVDRALVAVDGLHHPLEDGVEELARLLGVAVGEELHRALQVGEEHRDLLALAFEGGLRGEDLLGEVLRRVGLRVGCARDGLACRRGSRTSHRIACPAQGLRRTARRSVSSRLPQSSQNRSPSRFSAWHRGHVMAVGARLRPDRSHSCRQAERAA